MVNSSRLIVFGLALVIAVPLVAQNDDRASLMRADSLFASTYSSHDTTMALSLMHPDFVMTGVSGRLKDRAGELGDIRLSPRFEVPYSRSEGVDARVFGDAGVTLGELTWELQSERGSSIYRFRYTTTWRRGGAEGWQIMAFHVGPAVEAADANGR